MEVFGQWVQDGRILFWHLNRKDRYVFNHWGKNQGYVPNDGYLLGSTSNKFKLTLIY